jgi:hypothetical protein
MNLKKHLSLACMALAVGLTVGSAGAASITIVNANFEAPLFDEDGAGGSAAWYWVPDWDEGADSFYGDSSSSGGHLVYLDAGNPGWISQNLSYNWTAGDVFTLGIKGKQGWQSAGPYRFKIQLREADGTVLWDSGTVSVNSTWQNFSWSIDASMFSGAGVAPGSQLNIRIECLGTSSVYLDDVTLSTAVADTTPPTLASSAMVDDKSGGPVNPGQKVTYTVTFSEAMDTNTVSSSDFDNGGTAAVLIGTPTTSDSINYTIPVVASGTGTLRLRVPVGATMTDLVGNALDTSSAILDDTTISVVAKAIGVTGGGFEIPVLGTYAQPGDIPLWFNSTIGYGQWHNSRGYTTSGSQSALLQGGYMYQSLGQLAAGTKSLDWSFDQVRYTLDASTGTAGMRFFYGVALGASEGADIDTLGLTQIGSTVSIPALSGSDAFRSGSLDVSAVPAGSTIWVDFTHTGGSCFLLDNIAVTAVIPPSGTVISFF